MSDLQLTPASAWRPQSYPLKLPSSRVVEVREVDLIAVVMESKQEEIPDFISGQVMAMMNGKGSKKSLGDAAVNADNVQDVFSLINLVVRASVLSPRVVQANPNYDKGEIHINDLSTEEKIAIFDVCMPVGEAVAASTFRDRIEAANVAAIRDVSGDGEQGVPDTEDQQ